MEQAVQNITDVLPGHNHPGPSSYIAYVEGCRHPDCLSAFREYRLRLAARKLNGEYVDLRRRENRLRAEQEQFRVLHPQAAPEPSPQPVPEPQPATRPEHSPQLALEPPADPGGTFASPPPDTAATDVPGPVEEPESAPASGLSHNAAVLLDEVRHLAYSSLSSSHSVHEDRVRNMAQLKLGGEEYDAALTELEEAGKIYHKQMLIYLGPPAPKRAPAAKPQRNASTGYTVSYDATGKIRVSG